jgi:hypothetical protein
VSHEDQADKPECCQSCHYETDAISVYDGGPGKLRAWLCALCAESLAGNVHEYYTVYSGDVRILAGIVMNAANHIIAELRKRNVKP